MPMLLVGCSGQGETSPSPEPTSSTPGLTPTQAPADTPTQAPATPADTPTQAPTPVPDPGPIPRNTVPCQHPEYWPQSLTSTQVPITIHFQYAKDLETMQHVMGYLEQSWSMEMGPLGYRRPLDDGGRCGKDGNFDVFAWPDIDTCYVNASTANPSTDWNDYFTYMVLDPWGKYAGDILDSTLAHELNHGCQASDDWWDSPIIFEMTSTLIEDAVFDDDDEYMGLLEAFQSRPDWGIDRNDYYVTWYMYGATMTLFFVKDRYFDGDFAWSADMWYLMRNPPGADQDPVLNEPDFEDALDELLQAQAGVSFYDAVLELARWRYYTGSRDDGAHFEEGALFPVEAEVLMDSVPVAAHKWTSKPAPMVLGMSYVQLTGAPDETLTLSLNPQTAFREPVEGVAPQDPAKTGAIPVRYVVQALPGLPGSGSDGELLSPEGGPFDVTLMPDGTRTLVVTILPAGDYDPDTRTDDRYPFDLVWR